MMSLVVKKVGETMSKTIYVANLPIATSQEDVASLFRQYGEVLSINLIVDKATGEKLGYGFIEMDDPVADRAINELGGKEFKGQTLQVNQARGRSTNR